MSARPQAQIFMLQLEGMILSSRFELQYRVRCGGFSELWLARNTAPKEDEPESVVIKALNVRRDGEPDQALENALIEGMQREADALGQCKHDHIVRMLDCGVGRDNAGHEFPYLVLEYLPGGNLVELLRTRKLALSHALSLLGQISSALTCIHQHGFVHRDIKPQNIMLVDEDRSKLIDLGTVRDQHDGGNITAVGTPVYVAPEQCAISGTPVAIPTARTDVYAFAKTAYALITGEEPSAFKQRQITGLPGSVAHEPWALPVLQVLAKATSDNPKERHSSIAEFYDELCDATEVTSYRPRVNSQRQPRISRFEVNVSPLPPRPSKAKAVFFQLLDVLRWVTHGLTYVFFLTLHLLHWIWNLLRDVPRKLAAIVFAIVLISAGTLFFGPDVLRLVRRWSSPRNVATRPQTDSAVTLRATTDINIREAPGRNARKIGLVERDSTVRLLRKNQSEDWCEIEILSHGRPKQNAAFRDRGWVACQYLSTSS